MARIFIQLHNGRTKRVNNRFGGNGDRYRCHCGRCLKSPYGRALKSIILREMRDYNFDEDLPG